MRRVEAKKMNEEQAHLAWRPAQRHPDFYKVWQQKDPAAGLPEDPAKKNFDDLSCRNKRIIGIPTEVLRNENCRNQLLIA